MDRIVTTINPAVLPDGSNVADTPLPKTNPHICNQPYSEVVDKTWSILLPLASVTPAAQLPTACILVMVQKCHFGYPKPLQPETVFVLGDNENDAEDQEPVLFTACNNGLLNSFNPVQLSAWRANVDMQYCVSLQKVIECVTKYATKSEPRSLPLKEVYGNIVKSLKDDSTSLKAVQKLLINSVGERDYSAQETCHLLLQLPLICSSRDL